MLEILEDHVLKQWMFPIGIYIGLTLYGDDPPGSVPSARRCGRVACNIDNILRILSMLATSAQAVAGRINSLFDCRVDTVLVPMQCTGSSGCFPPGKRAAIGRHYPALP